MQESESNRIEVTAHRRMTAFNDAIWPGKSSITRTGNKVIPALHQVGVERNLRGIAGMNFRPQCPRRDQATLPAAVARHSDDGNYRNTAIDAPTRLAQEEALLADVVG